MKKPLIAFGVLVAFGFFLSFLQGPKQPTDGARIQKVEVPWQEKEDFSNALWYAKKEVQARLKSPSTAKFPPSSHDIGRVRYVGDQKYIIVTRENGAWKKWCLWITSRAFHQNACVCL